MGTYTLGIKTWTDEMIDGLNVKGIPATRNYRITVSMPCFGRPLRTKRSIEAILAQDMHSWEAIIIGDGCPQFQKLIDDGYMYDAQIRAMEKGNRLVYFNSKERSGGCGYKQTNFAIEHARGKYLVFYANDDIILPNHFSHYLEIEDTDLDYMYFNSYIDPLPQVRISKLAPSEIGHSEIIVKTELARKCQPHGKKYGHDWDFIAEIIRHGKGEKSKSQQITYNIMHIPNGGTKDTID